jgi:hypothetical protein
MEEETQVRLVSLVLHLSYGEYLTLLPAAASFDSLSLTHLL